MKRIPVLVAIGLLSANIAFAADDGLREAAERFAALPSQQKMMDDMLSVDAAMAQLRATLPGAREDEMRAMAEIVNDELQSLRPAMETAMIDAMVEIYTLEEIEAMTEFYSTPVGASVAEKTQPYMASFWARIGPEFTAMQGRLMSRMQQKMQ